MNYQSIGSGGGIKQIQARTVDFGASDMPLDPAELDKHGLVQWPQIMGGVVPVVNVEGVKAGALRLTGPVLADIYLGRVAKWNDPAIAQLNPDLKLPNQAIAVVEAPVMPWSRVRCIMRQSSKKCRRGQMKLAQMLAL